MKTNLNLIENAGFTENPELDFILKDQRFTEGLARLQNFLINGSIALITGQSGAGKTQLCKMFMSTLKPNKYKVYYINLTSCKTTGIIRLIMSKLKGSNITFGYKDVFMNDFIETISQENLSTVLIIDEAHILSDPALVDIRLLTSSIEEPNKFKLILSGQEILKNNLKKESHLALFNRISINYCLKQMNLEQSVRYIDYQLKKADLSDKLFTQEAKEKLHGLSNGIPRTINNIARTAFIIASIDNLSFIEHSVIERAYNDLSF